MEDGDAEAQGAGAEPQGGGGQRPRRPKGGGRGRGGPVGSGAAAGAEAQGSPADGRGGGRAEGAGGQRGGRGRGQGRREGGGQGGGHGWREGGGQGGGGGGRGRAPVPLGLPPEAALPGHPPARGTRESLCLLCCAEGPSYVGVGRCRHSDVCWVCTIRLRALSRDQRCPVCKEELDEVLLTDNAADATDSSSLAALSRLDSSGVVFADEAIRRAAMRLLGYRCLLDDCGRRRESAFETLKELEDHIWYVHWQQFCYTCIHSRPAFLCEQNVYGHNDLDRHCRYGDRGSLGGRRPTLPVPPHPLCEFCGERSYNDDALLQHMHRKHHLCYLCERLGRRNEFYSNWTCLALHYQDKHFVCAHKDCVRGGHRLIAFNDEEELHLHFMTEHSDGLTDKDRKLKMSVGQTSYADELRNRGKGQGKGRSQAAMEADEAQIHFKWPPGSSSADASGRDSQNELGDSDEEEDRYERYPTREIILDDGPSGATRGYPSRMAETSTQEEAPEGAGGDEAGAGAEAGNEAGDDEAAEEAPAKGEGEERELGPELERLDMDCATAADGPRSGTLSCLSALGAVLHVLVDPGSTGDEGNAADIEVLREAIQRLTPTEVEGLERMRAHLDDGSAFSKRCDWEPLERVLALRPLFFLLLRTSGAARAAGGGRLQQAIGPRQGPEVSSAAWRNWKVAARAAVLALGREEQLRLLRYTVLSMRRRAELSSIGGNDFPSLGGRPSAAPAAAAVAAAGESGQEQQPPEKAPPMADLHSAEVFPTLGGAGGTTAAGNAPSESRVVDGPGAGWGRAHRRQEAPLAEAFPTLGGTGAAGEEAKWGAARSSSNAAPPAKASGAPAAAPGPPSSGEAFPSLGGGAAAPSAEPVKWGASASKPGGSAASAAPQKMTMDDWLKPKSERPQELQEFQGMSTGAFPTLAPSAAPAAATATPVQRWAAGRGKAAAPSRAAAKAQQQRQRRQQELERQGREALANIAGAKEEDEEPAVPLVPLEEMVCLSKADEAEVPRPAAKGARAQETVKAPEPADAKATEDAQSKKKKGKKVLMSFG